MKKIIFLLSFIIFVITLTKSTACTTVIAGKNTTKDGSILFAKAEDDRAQLDYYWHINRKKHNADEIILAKNGLKIPQVRKTYAYFWDQAPKTSFSSMIINEWGVAFGSNACPSREDNLKTLEEQGAVVDGGLGFRLRFILAERCRSAREAVLLASELINKYGYNASGRSLNIVGPHEAWQLQMVRGKHYVARRVQDDEVAILANTYTIRDVDLNDPENFIYSADLVDYAIKRGWYNPERDGDFDFAHAYAAEDAHKSGRNTHRTWMLAKLLKKDFSLTIENAENGEMPVSVKPDRKLVVQDMIDLFSNHYENTILCLYEKEKISPHYIDNKPICNKSSHRVTIVQQRSWLPKEIGTVNWRALSHPCQSVFIPWYLGINNIPDTYKKAYEDADNTKKDLLSYHFNGPDWQIESVDLKSASCLFGLLNRVGDADYLNNHKKIRVVFDKMQKELLNNQEEFEKDVLKIYKSDKKKAIELLTDYTSSKAMNGYNSAKRLLIGFLEKQDK